VVDMGNDGKIADMAQITHEKVLKTGRKWPDILAECPATVQLATFYRPTPLPLSRKQGSGMTVQTRELLL